MGSAIVSALLAPFGSLSPFMTGLVSPFLVNTLIFIIAQLKKDNSIVDIGWSFLFIIPNLLALLKTHGGTFEWTPKQNLMFTLITIWGVRLSWHIGSRHTGVEDFRYQDMRRRWSAKGGQLFVLLMGFLYVFMMQAAFSVLINWASLKVSLNTEE